MKYKIEKNTVHETLIHFDLYCRTFIITLVAYLLHFIRD